MVTNVLLFASWAEALGATLRVDLPEGATVRHLLEVMRERAVGRSLPTPLVAVNHKYARPDTPLRPADEIAIIPPVAGG